MKILGYFKVRSLAKKYVELVLLKQALQSVREATSYDKGVSKALESLDKETTSTISDVISDAVKMGPRLARRWQAAAKHRIQKTKEAELLAPLVGIFTERFGLEFSKSLSKSIPSKFRKMTVDGSMIRLFVYVLDNLNLPT